MHIASHIYLCKTIWTNKWHSFIKSFGLSNRPTGGYAYGYMGPTHHALEDISAMRSLGLEVLVPAFDGDIEPMLKMTNLPTYLRFGYRDFAGWL